MKMNEKKAKEIKDVEKSYCSCDGFHPHDIKCTLSLKVEEIEIKYETPWHMLLHTATGYLEVIRKAIVLEDALCMIRRYTMTAIQDEITMKALTKWEKEK